MSCIRKQERVQNSEYDCRHGELPVMRVTIQSHCFDTRRRTGETVANQCQIKKSVRTSRARFARLLHAKKPTSLPPPAGHHGILTAWCAVAAHWSCSVASTSPMGPSMRYGGPRTAHRGRKSSNKRTHHSTAASMAVGVLVMATRRSNTTAPFSFLVARTGPLTTHTCKDARGIHNHTPPRCQRCRSKCTYVHPHNSDDGAMMVLNDVWRSTDDGVSLSMCYAFAFQTISVKIPSLYW